VRVITEEAYRIGHDVYLLQIAYKSIVSKLIKLFLIFRSHKCTEDKDNDKKDSFYEELEQVFDQFPRYHMKILIGDFNVKGGREGGRTFLNQ
jgi:hypothetical protein